MPKKIVVPVGSSNEMTKASPNLAINIYNYAHTDTDICIHKRFPADYNTCQYCKQLQEMVANLIS
jgi:hypothetical protein